jgi:hypothetical protein
VHQRQRGQEPDARVRLQPLHSLVAVCHLLELLVEAGDPPAEVRQQLQPAVALVAHGGRQW